MRAFRNHGESARIHRKSPGQPAVALTMLGAYRLLARRLGARKAWYMGFGVYWLVWCIGFPLWLLGFEELRSLFFYRRPRIIDWIVLVVPSMLSLIGTPGSGKRSRGWAEKGPLVCIAPVNGTLEEVLWRGVYLRLFPDSVVWGMLWPTLWFAMWHYAPGSLSPLTEVRTLMVGAGVYGALLSAASMKARSILWPATSHALAGLVQALR